MILRSIIFGSLALSIVAACNSKPKHSQDPPRALAAYGDFDISSDDGKSFRMGYGYDRLSGERRSSCLDSASQVVRRPLNATDSQFTMVSSKEDLAKSLNVEVNAEASGSYGIVGGSVSSKNKILKTSKFSSRNLMGIFSFMHRAEDISMDTKFQPLDANKINLLKTDSKGFRISCGDAYTKSVTTGAAIYIVVNISAKDSTTFDSLETKNSVSAAMSGIFSASVSAGVSKANKDALSKLNLSFSCHAVGLDSNSCTQALTSLNAEDDGGLSNIISYIDKAKAAVSTSIQDQPNKLVAIDETFEDYPKPQDLLDKKREEVFFGYGDKLSVIKKLLENESRVNDHCEGAKPQEACAVLQPALAKQIMSCARQDLWPDCDPKAIDMSRLDTNIAKVPTIGKIVLWENYQGGVIGGRSLTLDFDKSDESPETFHLNHIYNLKEYTFEDIATGYESLLQAGYQLRLFEHIDGQGSCVMIGAGSGAIADLEKFNDKASSMRLEKVGDYSTSCGG